MKSLGLALSLLLLAAACGGDDDTASGSGVVTGLVTDAASGARLEGVLVESNGQKVTSDALGQFTLEKLPAGPVVLRLTHEGYAPGYGNATVGDEAEGVLVTLKPEGARQAYDPSKPGVLYQTTEAGPYAVHFQPNTLNTPDTLQLRSSVDVAGLPFDLLLVSP